VRALFLGTGPRFARDAVGPVLTFYVIWKLVGLVPGIVAATLVAFLCFLWERQRERSGLGAAIGFTVALVQAAAGLATGSALAYFAPPVLVNGAWGLAFLGSVLMGRPLAGVFARETYPFPPEVQASATFRRTFSRVSLVWGVWLLCRCVIRLLALSWRNVEIFLVISIATGIPVTMALLSWSIWYGLRSFRRSPEWSWALGEGPAPR
jgi:hypothetical protein